MKITATHTFDVIRVHFDSTLHLAFFRSKLMGFEGWKESPQRFVIEYTFSGAAIWTEYDTEAHWREVLARLDEVI